MSFSDQQLKDAKAFVDLLKHHPDIIHHPSLGFFKEYLVSLDAKIPEQKYVLRLFVNNRSDHK